MAPRAAARASRNQPDNDVLSGMPVRQYVKAPITVSLVPPKAPRPKKDTVWKELPMPKGSELYPLHSQQILRQARMPWVPLEDRDDPDDADEDGEGEDADAFTVSKWVLVEQGQERPTKNLLADRPKSLPPLYGGAPGQAPMRKVKVRRVEPDGSLTFFEVLAPAGVPIDGEVAPSEAPAVATEAIAPGTVVEGVGVANSEGVVVAAEAATPQSNRRKPPPPKRKKHGPGRGRKKKVMLEMPNADGTMETTEAATPGRTEGDDDDGDDDDGDDDGKEDGEMSDEVGTPTPTPSRGGLPEPPRSIPVDLKPTNLAAAASAAPPVVAVEAEKSVPQIREPGDEGFTASADAMQVDSVVADSASAPAATDIIPTPTKEEPLDTSERPTPLTIAPPEPTIATEIGSEALQQTEPAATSLEPAAEAPLEPAQVAPDVPASEPLAQPPITLDDPLPDIKQATPEADNLSNAPQAGSPVAADAAEAPAVETSATAMDIATIAPPEPEMAPMAASDLGEPTDTATLPEEKPPAPLAEPLPETAAAPPPSEDIMAVDAIIEEPKKFEEAPAVPTPITELAAASAMKTDQDQTIAQAPPQPPALGESDMAQPQPQPQVDEQPPTTAPSEEEQKPTEAAAPIDTQQSIEPPVIDAPVTAALLPPTTQPEEMPATVAGEAIPPVPAPVADPLPEPIVPSEAPPAQPFAALEPMELSQPAQPENLLKEDRKTGEDAANTDSAAPIPDLLTPAPEPAPEAALEAPTQVDIRDGTEPSEPTAAHPDPLAVPSFPEIPPTTEGEGGEAGETQAAREDGMGSEEKDARTGVEGGVVGGNGPTAPEGAAGIPEAAATEIATDTSAGDVANVEASTDAGVAAVVSEQPLIPEGLAPQPAEPGAVPVDGSEKKEDAPPAAADGQDVLKTEE